MRFVVPQFIDTEDKIIGPFSTRQFLLIMAGAGVMFIEYQLSEFWFFAVQAVFTLMLTGVFAFLKINGQGFHYFLLNLVITFRRPKVKVWNKDSAHYLQKSKEKDDEGVSRTHSKKPLSSSKLTELSLVVDTGGAYKQDDRS